MMAASQKQHVLVTLLAAMLSYNLGYHRGYSLAGSHDSHTGADDPGRARDDSYDGHGPGGRARSIAAQLEQLVADGAVDVNARVPVTAAIGIDGNALGNAALRWRLNMRDARPFPGIPYPLENGLAARCIPATVIADFNAELHPRNARLMAHKPADPALPPEHTASQVGDWVFANLNFENSSGSRRPIWTLEIWDHLLSDLRAGEDGGPPGYIASGRSVRAATEWALGKSDCGVGATDCRVGVFSAITPWVEAIVHDTAINKLSPSRKISLSSVDFNPCIIDRIPASVLRPCTHVLDLKDRGTFSFDFLVSYSGIEHDGLGRYGDPVNPEGDISALREMWLHVRPGGMLFLAVPQAGMIFQPRTKVRLWTNGVVPILRDRLYGAARYARLLTGWHFEAWVINGELTARDAGEAEMSALGRMTTMCEVMGEHQPVLVMRKLKNVTFDQILDRGQWSAEKTEAFTKAYETEMASTYWQHTVGGRACASIPLSGYMCVPDRCPFGCRGGMTPIEVTCDTADRKDCAEQFRARCDADDKCLSFAMSATEANELKGYRRPGTATAKFYPYGTKWYEDTSSKYPQNTDTTTMVWQGGKPDDLLHWLPNWTVYVKHSSPNLA